MNLKRRPPAVAGGAVSSIGATPMPSGWTPTLSGHLTLRESSFPVLDGSRQIGVVIRNSAGLYVGWGTHRLGEFASQIDAARAVIEAHRTAKRRRRP